MKIKTKKTTEVEIELDLPYFFKKESSDSVHANLVGKTIRIWSNQITIHNYESDSFLTDDDNTQITAEEFTRIFDERIEELQSLKSNFITK